MHEPTFLLEPSSSDRRNAEKISLVFLSLFLSLSIRFPFLFSPCLLLFLPYPTHSFLCLLPILFPFHFIFLFSLIFSSLSFLFPFSLLFLFLFSHFSISPFDFFPQPNISKWGKLSPTFLLATCHLHVFS